MRFYFGTKRPHSIQTQSTMNQKRYAKLIPGEKDQLIDELDLQRTRASLDYDSNRRDYYYAENKDKLEALAEGRAGGGGGGGGGGFRRELSLLRQNAASFADTATLSAAKAMNAPAA